MLSSEDIDKMTIDHLLGRPDLLDDCGDNPSRMEQVGAMISKLKNGVIGSNVQKEKVFKHDFVKVLLRTINNEIFGAQLRIDAVIVIGSLAKGSQDHTRLLIDSGTLPVLIENIRSSDAQLVEACLRALRSIVCSSSFPLELIYKDDQTVEILLKAGRKSNFSLEFVGQILIKSCVLRSYQELLFRLGAVDLFAPSLFSSVLQFKVISLDVLSALCRGHKEISNYVAMASHMGIPLLDQIKRIMSQEMDKSVRLASARCLTYLFRSDAISSVDSSISRQVMPLLVRCCKSEVKPTVCTKSRVLACETLACLIEEDSNLQELTIWNNMCLKIINQCLSITEVDSSITDEQERTSLLDGLHESSFNVLSHFASNSEDLRRKVVHEIPNLLERILNGLYGSIRVQIASIKCLHSLSRSVEQLRTVFLDKPVARQLLQLMQSDNLELTCVSVAAISNLLLEFSPCKSILIECGCVPILCSLSKSDDPSVRLHGIWGLMNLTYKADEKVKSAVLRHFTPADALRNLTEMSNESLAVGRLIGFMRNILHTKEFADQLIPTYGNSFVQCVIFVLEGDYSVEDKEQALSVLVNLSNSGLGKEFIMSNEDVRSKILNYMMHANSRFQVAATCTICNLISRDEPGSFERQAILKEWGIIKLLQQLLTTKDPILFEKVHLALQSLS